MGWGMPTRDYLDEGGLWLCLRGRLAKVRTVPNSGQHHFTVWSPELNEKEKGCQIPEFIVPCFLNANAGAV